MILILLGKNFEKFIDNLKASNENADQQIETIKKYTFHDTQYCTRINLLLASDSEDLKEEAIYIKKLQNAIFNLAKHNPFKNSVCFRGMHMSEKEYQAYPEKEFIYIPSFLSTSKNDNKFYLGKNNCLIEIKLNYLPNNAIVINEKLSIYSEDEEEVLFGCYSKFKVQKKCRNYNYKNNNFEYFLQLEHINETTKKFDSGNILMLSFLGL